MGQVAPTSGTRRPAGPLGFFYVPRLPRSARHVVDARGLFHVHTMRYRIVTVVHVLEILSLAHWLVTELSELLHFVAHLLP